MRRSPRPLALAAVLLASCDPYEPTPAPPALAPTSRVVASAPAPPVRASATAASTASADTPPSVSTIATPAGVVTITGDPNDHKAAALDGKSIYPPACPAGGPSCAKVAEMTKDMPLLGVLATYTPSGSKELVVLFQASMMGNACNGGPLFFVRFKSGGAFVYSDPFDHCGGPDPKLTRRGDVVRIRVPSAPPNRGTGIVPGQEAEYDLATGVLTQRVLRSP